MQQKILLGNESLKILNSRLHKLLIISLSILNYKSIFFIYLEAGYPAGTVGKGDSWLELLDAYIAPVRPPRPPEFNISSSSFTIAAFKKFLIVHYEIRNFIVL